MENNISLPNHFFQFLCLSLWYSRTHYPTLENPDAQNMATCKNQSKQPKLSDHWKSIETFLKKYIIADNTKKMKSLTEMQVLTKEFIPYNIRYKSVRKIK